MHLVLISSGAINEYVVEVNEYEIIDRPLHNCVHQTLECTWCITKVKRKHSILKQPIPHCECHFLKVIRRKPDLVVPTEQINDTEVL